ncbi:Protein kinase-like domain protein [Metarhizium rileyi]|uniref:mitogen-activated protein kinase kinase n=1 Tax=Metarhizium rileyi (strain RCEF 4871) TaxID=1649241 RepID=A0A166VZK2_METRR|nr:Protein kinase-like domain protein [Metarhizium rileyi RCEF 4871]
MADSPSSQRTNEDPTGPTSRAAQAILTLTPSNAAAKRAFSDVVGWTLQRSQRDIEDDSKANSGSRSPDPRDHAKKFMWISSEQTSDPDVSRFIRQHQVGQLSPSPNSSFDGSAAQKVEPESAIHIWTGCFFLDLNYRTIRPGGGWRAGRLNEQTLNDVVLAVDDSSAMGVRVRHIVLQVHEQSGRIYVRSVTDKADVEVDGMRLSRGQVHVMNNRSTHLRIGQLAYHVEYAHFACNKEYSEEYKSKLKIYIQTWTISSAGTIGSGGGGRVSAAMNSSGDIVALKRMTATKGSKSLQKRINTLQLLTTLADNAQENRILRLREVITDDPTGSNPSSDVWFVLFPALPKTLYDYRPISLLSEPQGSVLCMLTPMLLDLDDAMYAPTGHVSAAAGLTGTVGWLSPERELDGFTATSDVWAVGVVAIWLLFGRHPWPCLVNPWRAGLEYEKHQPQFHKNLAKPLLTFDDITWMGRQYLQQLGIQELGFDGVLYLYGGSELTLADLDDLKPKLRANVDILRLRDPPPRRLEEAKNLQEQDVVIDDYANPKIRCEGSAKDHDSPTWWESKHAALSIQRDEAERNPNVLIPRELEEAMKGTGERRAEARKLFKKLVSDDRRVDQSSFSTVKGIRHN